MPPLDLKAPPDDASKTASGLAYKKLTVRDTGAQPKRSDTVLVHYTGWRQRTGETFFTTKGISQPMSVDVAHAAPGFSEAVQQLRKGEKAVVWVPPGQGTGETLVYEIEVVDIVSPPKVAEPTPEGQKRQPEGSASQPQPQPQVH
jgi:peptidylprolyl isomerase